MVRPAEGRNNVYSSEFKVEVVEYMHKEGLSARSTAENYNVKNKRQIQDWERIYLEKGKEGLFIERRGRGKGGGRPPKLGAKVEEDLIAEVQRLRMENEYLKKLNALVLEKGKLANKKKRK
jgi:transposase-like protein